MGDLNEKQRRFVDEYLVDLNASAAARRAGYSENTAYQIGHELLKKPEVVAALQIAMDRRAQRTQITQDRVLQEIGRLAFFDARRLFDDDGTPKDIAKLDDDTAAALVGLDVADLFEGSGENREKVGLIKKYKLANKGQALEMAGRHLGLFNDKLTITEDALGNLSTAERSIVRDAIKRILAGRLEEVGPSGQSRQTGNIPPLH